MGLPNTTENAKLNQVWVEIQSNMAQAHHKVVILKYLCCQKRSNVGHKKPPCNNISTLASLFHRRRKKDTNQENWSMNCVNAKACTRWQGQISASRHGNNM